MSLKIYNRKRNFSQTPEPKGQSIKKKASRPHSPLRFVVQMHRATRMHFDFRLEFGGVFKSWAVPKGPSLNPLDQRLAVFVEDHPIEYGSFEGIIPKGNYGAGTVMIWDEGTYVERSFAERSPVDRKQSEDAMLKAFEKGHITFVLNGHKLKGEFALIKLKNNADEKAWLLVKKRDAYSTYKRTEIPDNISVKTGRTIEEIAEQSLEAGNVWLPKRKKSEKPKATPHPVRSRDAMPRKNKPMLASVSRKNVIGTEWIFEKQNDGLRALAEIEGKRVHLYSRSGLPYEKKFSEVVEDLKNLNCHAVLDGEILEIKGRPFYSVFDILYFNGTDLRKEPLRRRKNILNKAIPKRTHLGCTPTIKPKNEPVVAKNLESLYRAGTTSDWLLIQNPLSSPRQKSAKKTVASKTPLAEKEVRKPRGAHIVTQTQEPRLTNLDKVYWPNEGITKGALLTYYKQMAPYILPYLKDRPESLNRQPNGIAAPGFYQKDMTGHIPRWLKTERIFSESADKSIDYVLCQDERSLLYIVNLGCIEINPWFSRIGTLEHPDFLVIDLDPDGNHFDHVIEIAHEVHDLLAEVGARSFCKTSGATGIHIGIPVGARYDFDTGRAFTEDICRIIAKKFPATTSIERSPNRRRKKIYLDFMQNRRGQTLAAPFCVRPRPHAPVSMPLTWKELRPGLKPEQFNIQNALRLIQKRTDAWKGVLGSPIDLDKCVKSLKRKMG